MALFKIAWRFLHPPQGFIPTAFVILAMVSPRPVDAVVVVVIFPPDVFVIIISTNPFMPFAVSV